MGKMTTIQISEETHEALAACKVHPREPYESVIRRLLAELRGRRQ